MTFYYFKYNFSAQQSLARLQNAFDDEEPSNTTIYSWFKEFFNLINRCCASFDRNKQIMRFGHLWA